MATAPTLVAVSEATSGSVGAASQTSGTLSWQAGDIVVVLAVEEGGGAETWSTPTNTGTGLGSWTALQVHNTAGTDTGIGAWAATATATGSGTVTVAKNNSADRMSITAWQWRAASGTSISVGASTLVTGKTTSPQTAAITMSGPDSAVMWTAGDWSAAAVESPSPAASSHSTTAPGPSAMPVATQTGTNYTYYYDDQDDSGAASGSQSYGYSGSSTGPIAIIVVEIAVSGPVTPDALPISDPAPEFGPF